MVDKTGTLTLGKPQLTSLVPAEGFDEVTLLQAAASLEKASEHPLAAAILATALAKKVELTAMDDFQSITGKGVTGTLRGSFISLTTNHGSQVCFPSSWSKPMTFESSLLLWMSGRQ